MGEGGAMFTAASLPSPIVIRGTVLQRSYGWRRGMSTKHHAAGPLFFWRLLKKKKKHQLSEKKKDKSRESKSASHTHTHTRTRAFTDKHQREKNKQNQKRVCCGDRTREPARSGMRGGEAKGGEGCGLDRVLAQPRRQPA
jgi:hypothetical protein